MQIDCYKEESISFKITNTNGDNAVNTFYGILSKCKNVAMKKGFNNMFTSEEKAFIKEFTDTVQGNET